MTSRSGGLLELVARGKKDVFFTANPVLSYFHSVYVRSAPFTKETYVTKARNNPDWGHWVDFDIEHRGDIVREFYLRINLPTWLPPAVAAINPTGLVTDGSGVTFGYCSSIGFQLISCIQLFVDQVLIHEFYGEHLDWRLKEANDIGKTLLISKATGLHYGTKLGIQRSATLGELRVPIPVIGSQHIGDPGLPLAALRNQRFRMRVHIRPISEVLVASDGRIAPSPFSIPLRVQATKGGPIDISATSLRMSDMVPLDISLESTNIYVPADVQVFLKAQTLRIPFQTVQFQEVIIADNKFTAAAPPFSIDFKFPFPLDFIGPADRLLIGIRSDACTRAGQRRILSPPTSAAFIKDIRINIANIDRIQQFPVEVFHSVTNYWKDTAPNILEFYTITFGGFDFANPAGTLNLTRAALPTVIFTLAPTDYDERTISRLASALVYAETWGFFAVANGKGAIMFEDT